jgi:hypothetical protein
VSRRLVALLTLLWPSRGRHRGTAAPAAPEEAEEPPPAPPADDEGVSPADMTIFDAPPARVRRYVDPGNEDGAS